MKPCFTLSVKIRYLLSSFSIVMLLTACTSIGKGIAQAVLEKSETEDARQCQVWGQPFTGIQAGLGKEKGKTKVLFVHGVGDHIPGYTTQFLEKLAKELNLTARAYSQKNIGLSAPLLAGKDLGNLRVSHLLNEERGIDLTFYELTWSQITRKQKELLVFDNSGEYDFRRAKINSLLKKFSNDTGPDPIIYLGDSRDAILAAFTQSFCWMATGDWDDLPASGIHACTGLNDSSADYIAHDDYVFISHSLGSRITIDGMQRIAHLLANVAKYADASNNVNIADSAVVALQNKQVPIYMLSNQLPMLQLGRELPEVVGSPSEYCSITGANYNKRMVSKTEIIAFSDPNDLLSYGIPPGFAEQYIDTRLCPSITNVSINIARVMDAFGLADLANPLEAHVGYDNDDRVIALIAKGIDHPNASPLVNQRCEFTKEVK
ncbi:MAG: hypothetical protein Q7U98_08080 [Methylicorpusculum sp.]|uniref:hypothetical protein n=1 Tax=Methylicorpusculum sp. TaxID=2713644 RepID=UPI00271B032B|nr:hypothetical protein [Methylicorpusculum sp.]MDO8843663.1 hypothetical protein [Methylicorpusculum sp.]MDO8939105.1 hypothetical protein [Methylicorpusculum sp.]MDP2200696.1 hypothetical protein [Methylicorpusculum sp.]